MAHTDEPIFDPEHIEKAIITPEQVRGMMKSIARRLDESGGPSGPFWIATTEGGVLVNEFGCFFVDEEGNITGPAAKQLVIDALESK